jgi:hypothetical protein
MCIGVSDPPLLGGASAIYHLSVNVSSRYHVIDMVLDRPSIFHRMILVGTAPRRPAW